LIFTAIGRELSAFAVKDEIVGAIALQPWKTGSSGNRSLVAQRPSVETIIAGQIALKQTLRV
jgi:hypothetical protein